jgi:hypothetical protein
LKKALVYLILLVFLFNLAGYHLVFEISKRMARREMAESLLQNPGRLVMIHVANTSSNKDFRRMNGNEIMFRGVMFDIVNEVNKGDESMFVCKPDLRESKLLDGFREIASHKAKLAVWEWLESVYISPVNDQFHQPSCHIINFPSFVTDLVAPPVKSWSPPPEII